MHKYIEQRQNTRDTKFVVRPKTPDKSYSKRLKVEETFSRYKRIIGTKFKAQHFLGQQYEAKLSLQILNKMMAIVMPKTILIG